MKYTLTLAGREAQLFVDALLAHESSREAGIVVDKRLAAGLNASKAAVTWERQAVVRDNLLTLLCSRAGHFRLVPER